MRGQDPEEVILEYRSTLRIMIFKLFERDEKREKEEEKRRFQNQTTYCEIPVRVHPDPERGK